MPGESPYKVWDSHRSIAAIRDVKPILNYWLELAFGDRLIVSEDEWIDFEKLPAVGRKLAPFVRPLGAGKPLYEDSSGNFRFKPAYIKVKEAIDPLAPLVRRPGIDTSILNPAKLSATQRRNLLRAQMTVQATNAIRRRWEWMAARAIIDAKVTIEGEEYPAVELDFRRDVNHDIIKTPGTLWGDPGISIFDDVQGWADQMFDAEFGGFPTRLTLTPAAWAVFRKDPEIQKHMDTQIKGGRAEVERGLIGPEKALKVGELQIGGASGAVIEVWLYRDTFLNEAKAQVPFLADGEVVLTSSADAINAYRAFGAIIDPYANYQSLEIFSRSWMTQDDPAVEYMLFQSAPLMVPINPNATLRAKVR